MLLMLLNLKLLKICNSRSRIDHDNIDIESEDTISVLNRYVEESELS